MNKHKMSILSYTGVRGAGSGRRRLAGWRFPMKPWGRRMLNEKQNLGAFEQIGRKYNGMTL